MAFGAPDDAYNDFYNLSRLQSGQSLGVGDRAAKLADPYAEQRKKDIDSLNLLESDPGRITTSPFFQFLADQQMNAVKANNAGRGLTRSGRGAMALQDRAAGVASQAYFPLLQNLTTRAMSGSSPTAAGVTYERGVGRSQDQQQMGAAARAIGASGGAPRSSVSPSQQMMDRMPVGGAPTYAPAGTSSFGMPYSGGYDANKDPMAGYTPSADAGTGYAMSEYGVQGLNGPGSQYYAFGENPEQPTTQATYDPYQDPYASGDFGYGGGDYGE